MKNIALVIAEFYPEFAEKMLSIALKTAKKEKLKVIKIVRVYGVFDIPLKVKILLKNKKINGVAVLGCVIKGETAHDKVIVESTANAITFLSLEFEKPVSLGIIGYNASLKKAKARLEEYSKRAIESLKKSLSN